MVKTLDGPRVRVVSPVVKEKVYGGKDLLKSQVLSSEWNTERVREDASGDSEDGEDDELPCVIGESAGDWVRGIRPVGKEKVLPWLFTRTLFVVHAVGLHSPRHCLISLHLFRAMTLYKSPNVLLSVCTYVPSHILHLALIKLGVRVMSKMCTLS